MKVLVIKIVLAYVVQTVLGHWPAPLIKGTVSQDFRPLLISLKRRYTVYLGLKLAERDLTGAGG